MFRLYENTTAMKVIIIAIFQNMIYMKLVNIICLVYSTEDKMENENEIDEIYEECDCGCEEETSKPEAETNAPKKDVIGSFLENFRKNLKNI